MPALVNQNNVTKVRKELELPFFELVDYMRTLGWSFHIQYPFDSKKGYVSFQKQKDWHGLALYMGRYKFGYTLDSVDESVVLNIAQRSAELCLTVFECFTTKRPSNANIHGEIIADPIFDASPYAETTQAELDLRHAHFNLKRIDFNHKDEDLLFKLHGEFLSVPRCRIEEYLHAINKVEDALNGLQAIIV